MAVILDSGGGEGAGLTRRDFLRASSAAALSLLLGCRGPAAARGNGLNLILIVSDTLRADRLGCYGSALGITPNIDALARRGTVFENVMSCAPLTGASHVSLMTGAYQTRHGIPRNYGRLPGRLVTLAQKCRAAGYRTAAMVSNPVLGPRSLNGIDRGFDLYDAEFPSMERNRDDAYRDATDTTAVAHRWLRAGPRQPFFLWMHYQEPHGPYEVPERSFREKAGEVAAGEVEAAVLPVMSGDSGRGGIPRYQVLGTARAPDYYRGCYAARTAYVDSRIGRLLDEVGRLGLEQDTVVAFTSDHGELLGEHEYYFQHGITVLQPVLHIPLILAGPSIRVGERASQLASNTDIMPTVLDLLDIGCDDIAGQLDGCSLAPMLQRGAAGDDRCAYSMCESTGEWSVREGQYKFVLAEPAPNNRGRLADLEEDPAEERDVSAEEPLVAERLRDNLLRFRSAAPRLLAPGERQQELPALTDEDKRRFRALGYLD